MFVRASGDTGGGSQVDSVEALVVTAKGKAKWVLWHNKCRVLRLLGGEMAKVNFMVSFKVSSLRYEMMMVRI